MARILLFALTAVFTWPSPAQRSGRRYPSTRIQRKGTAKGIDIGQIYQEGTTSVARRLAERAMMIQTSTGSVRVVPSLHTAQFYEDPERQGGHMKKRFGRIVTAAVVTGVVLLASGLLVVADVDDQFSDWSAPANVGPPVNTESNEAGPFISKDGLTLYFNSTRPEGFGGLDIYVSKRERVDDPWGEPKNLGPTINSSSNDQTAALSPDGHRLYFASDRPGGFGRLDLYVSRRHDKDRDFDDFGNSTWQAPVNLGSNVNSKGGEVGPTLFEDDVTGTITLYFSSDPSGGVIADGRFDIYASTLGADESFGPAVIVTELSSPVPFNDFQPAVRRDGLEVFLASNRPGGLGGLDIWVSTRASTSDPWSPPVNVTVVNSPASDQRPALSFDGTSLYFVSNRLRPDTDLYVSTREKL